MPFCFRADRGTETILIRGAHHFSRTLLDKQQSGSLASLKDQDQQTPNKVVQLHLVEHIRGPARRKVA